MNAKSTARAVKPLESVADAWATQEMKTLVLQGLRRELEPVGSRALAVIRVGGESLVNFSSNDYLGLTGHPRVLEAATVALQRDGFGSGAARLVTGDFAVHGSLERALAGFMRSESALLFNSGYAANLGAIQALMGEGDVIFSDALNHASLIDGCRLSRARTIVYSHLDVGSLAALLERNPGRRRLVVTESVFSMDGDLAPLADLVEVCQAHGAALMVDEAHAIGVFGQNGAGLCDELRLGEQVDLRMGTLGKALGGFGAFIATSERIRELLLHRARSFVFSTSLPPSLCAAAQAALELVTYDSARREQLWQNTRRFASGLAALGKRVSALSPIFPLVVGEPAAALECSKFFRARGLLVKPIRPPTVPAGTSRLRFAISAAHTEGHIDHALEAISDWEVRRSQP